MEIEIAVFVVVCGIKVNDYLIFCDPIKSNGIVYSGYCKGVGGEDEDDEDYGLSLDLKMLIIFWKKVFVLFVLLMFVICGTYV